VYGGGKEILGTRTSCRLPCVTVLALVGLARGVTPMQLPVVSVLWDERRADEKWV
jgi:hypothetical protein